MSWGRSIALLWLLGAVTGPSARPSERPREAAGTSASLQESVTPTRPRREHLTHRLTRTSPWFVNPAPGSAPNGFLQKGTRVQLLSQHGAWVRVWTEEGAVFAGYVTADVLRRLR